MGRIDGKQLKNNDLTGSNLNRGIGIYDETESLIAGQKRFWNGQTYQTNTSITGVERDDLSNAPDISTDWDSLESLGLGFFSAYNTTSQSIPANIKWLGVFEYDSSTFMHSTTVKPENITIGIQGKYHIHIDITNYISSGTKASESKGIVKINTGSGWSSINGTSCYMLHNKSGQSLSTGSIDFIYSFNAGDKIRIRTTKVSGTSTLKTVLKGCRILLEKI